MARTYEWSQKVAAAIAALPERDGEAFWALVEGSGHGAAPRTAPLVPEVLAYLVREAYGCGARVRVERLVAVLWDRYAPHVLYYASQYQTRLLRGITADDVAIEVFTLLCNRLRNAEATTFYECCFLPGLKRLTLDKVQRLDDEPLVSLTVQRAEGEEEEQDLPDHGAIDPQEQAEEGERHEALRQLLPSLLDGLPERARRTAYLLMQGKGEGEIAADIGVSTRMVTNYKVMIRKALTELA